MRANKAILEPYRGRPVLLDLWETTCGSCRMAFKHMHDKKIELADLIHFVNIADGSIHHAFIGWGNIDIIMKEIEPVLQ